MSDPAVFTRWCCDNPGCTRIVTIPGAHTGLPDERGWKQITLVSGYGSTNRHGTWRTPEKAHHRLACSIECAQEMLAERWKFTG